MDLLQFFNTALVSTAALVGVCAVGRLFYVASTAPTNVRRKSSAVGPTIFPTIAWDGNREVYTATIIVDGSRRTVSGSKLKTGYSEEPVK
jgi:hypothetical protein